MYGLLNELIGKYYFILMIDLIAGKNIIFILILIIIIFRFFKHKTQN